MDARPRLARATRFFARPETFILECPKCGTVYHCGPKKSPYWDPTTARFHCNRGTGACDRSYVMGMLAWGPYLGKLAKGNRPSPPRDQVPGPRELAQMRAEGSGWWMADEDRQAYVRPEETNLTTEEERPDRDPEDED